MRRWILKWEIEKENWRRRWIVEEKREKWVWERERIGFCNVQQTVRSLYKIWVILHWPRQHCQVREKINRSGGYPLPSERMVPASSFFVKLWRLSGKASGVQIRWFLSLNNMELNYLRNPKVGIWKLGKLQNGTIHGHAYRDKLRKSIGWVS